MSEKTEPQAGKVTRQLYIPWSESDMLLKFRSEVTIPSELPLKYHSKFAPGALILKVTLLLVQAEIDSGCCVIGI